MAQPTVNLEAAQQFFAAFALELVRTNDPPYNGPNMPLVPLAAQSAAFRAADDAYRQLLGYDDDNFGEVFNYAMPAEHGGARMVYAHTDSTPHAAELYEPDGTFVGACVIHFGRVAWVTAGAARAAMTGAVDELFPPVTELVWVDHTPEVCETLGGRFSVNPLGGAAQPLVLSDGTTGLRHPCANMAAARALAQQLHAAG